MYKTISYTHTVALCNGVETTFTSCWPAEDVIGGLTFIHTERGVEYWPVSAVLKTIKKVQHEDSGFSLY